MSYDTWEEYEIDHKGAKRRYVEYYRPTSVSYKYRQNKRKEKAMANTYTIKRRDNAPGFVFGSFGLKLEDLKAYVNDKGYVNFDILANKDNTGYYVKINDYGLKQESTKKESDTVMNFDEDIEMPF